MTNLLFPEVDYVIGWDGTKLKGPSYAPLAFDTETTVVEISKECPQCVLATVSDGVHNFILRPEELYKFIIAHKDCHWVGHNFAFDFWVVVDQLERQGAHSWGSDFKSLALGLWWDMAANGQFHDTMYLDLLVRLATGSASAPVDTEENSGLFVRNLGQLAARYSKIEVNKKDPYRKRYGELLGADWSQAEEGFFTYAIKDAIATYQIWPKLYAEAIQLQKRFMPKPGEEHYVIYPDAIDLFGPLTEKIQVQAAIALLKVSRNGMHVDLHAASLLEESYRQKIKDKQSYLLTQHPNLFSWKTDRKTGEKSLELTKKSQMPKIKQEYLKEQLTQIAQKLSLSAPESTGKKGGISLSIKRWVEHQDKDPFLAAWIGISHYSKILGFFDIFREHGDVIHCVYNILMRTGRTSCQKPNLQQMPRNKEFRSLFTARPGYKLLTIDYSAIELRTLATVCKAKFGYSKLAEIFYKEPPYNDPHSFTAAMVLGKDLISFMELENSFKKEARQRAKACFSSDTELLTPQGWEKIEDLYERDVLVAQYNPHNKEITFTRPLCWVRNENSSFIEIDSTYMNQKVTPDHRLLLIGKGTDTVREVLAQDLERKMEECWLTVHGGFIKNEPKYSELVTRLSVMVQADGSFYKNQVRLGFTKKRKIDRCRALLTQAKVPFSEKPTSQGAVCFTLQKGDWYALTEDKHFINFMDYHHEAFIQEVGLWDGCVKHKHAASYTNTSLKDVITVQTILVLNGYKTNVGAYIPSSDNRNPCYSLYWYTGDRKKNPQYARCNRETTTYTHSEVGTSYCLSVPTSWVLTRREGKVSVSGNCNFGVPGGLGPQKLLDYAKNNYGVELTHEQAEELRHKLITEIYPELNDQNGYLACSTIQDLAVNLGVNARILRVYLEDRFKNAEMALRCMERLARGKAEKADGTPYKQEWIIQLWDAFDHLIKMSPLPHKKLRQLIKDRETGLRLVQSFFYGTACTLTGRVRAQTSYTQSRNTPFQSLAADGGKLALFRLILCNYRVVAWVHDECVIEVPEETAEADQKIIEEIMCKAMSEVLKGSVPVACEGHLDTCWSK